jgi:hypothetical protein
VARLGEFLPLGRFFKFGQIFKDTEAAHFLAVFHRKCYMYVFVLLCISIYLAQNMDYLGNISGEFFKTHPVTLLPTLCSLENVMTPTTFRVPRDQVV